MPTTRYHVCPWCHHSVIANAHFDGTRTWHQVCIEAEIEERLADANYGYLDPKSRRIIEDLQHDGLIEVH